MKGTIEGGDGPVVVKLKGVRPPNGFPVLTGRTTEANLKGKAVKSKALDLSVVGERRARPAGLRLSRARGRSTIDKDEVPDVTLDGRVILTPELQGVRAPGRLERLRSRTREGQAQRRRPEHPDPEARVSTSRPTPKLKLKGQLTEAVEPILLVTPTSLRLPAHSSRTRPSTHHVQRSQNVGTGSLSGTVSS